MTLSRSEATPPKDVYIVVDKEVENQHFPFRPMAEAESLGEINESVKQIRRGDSKRGNNHGCTSCFGYQINGTRVYLCCFVCRAVAG